MAVSLARSECAILQVQSSCNETAFLPCVDTLPFSLAHVLNHNTRLITLAFVDELVRRCCGPAWSAFNGGFALWPQTAGPRWAITVTAHLCRATAVADMGTCGSGSKVPQSVSRWAIVQYRIAGLHQSRRRPDSSAPWAALLIGAVPVSCVKKPSCLSATRSNSTNTLEMSSLCTGVGGIFAPKS